MLALVVLPLGADDGYSDDGGDDGDDGSYIDDGSVLHHPLCSSVMVHYVWACVCCSGFTVVEILR